MKDMYGGINLLQIPGATLTTLQGKTRAKKCIVIPVEDMPSIRETNTGCYLNVRVCEMQEVKWGNTHYIKLSTPASALEGKSYEERNALRAIIGNLRPAYAAPTDGPSATTPQASASAPASSGQADGRLHFPEDKPKPKQEAYHDDLPF